MKLMSKVELSAGVGTVVLALGSSGFFIIATKSLEVLEDYVLYIGLAMLVAIGSYFHVIRGRITGLVILLISGLTLAAMGLLGGVIFYARGSWRGLPVVLPCVSATIAVVAGILATRSRQISG
jgi:hypothetical protein